MHNGIYDLINMGSFNFVNAAFDDVYGRKPSSDEFNRSFKIIEKNIPTFIFNQVIILRILEEDKQTPYLMRLYLDEYPTKLTLQL